MNVPTKLGAYGAGLAVVFTAALAVGNGVGTSGGPAPASHGTQQHRSPDGGDLQTMDHAEAITATGLEVSANGYTFEPMASSLAAGDHVPFRFRIVGPGGEPVTRYEREHDKDLHLIVVRRDLAGYQHVHPTLDDAGVWSVELDLDQPGTYRALADFTATGAEGLTLGVDLQVPGDADLIELPRPSRSAEVDGYRVSLEGDVIAGEAAELELSITKDGRPVTDLQPYLAAYGHLVALRAGDLAYLHVHPEGAPGDGRTPAGPGITFFAEVPSVGAYRLFLDFRHNGVVRTAEFTVEATSAPTPTAEPSSNDGGHHDKDES